MSVVAQPAVPIEHHASTGLYVKSPNGLKLRDRRVQRLVRKMRAAMHWLEDADVPACRAWAQLEILADSAFAHLRSLGIVNAKGETRRLVDDLRKLRLAQLAYAKELGMTPAARMAIKATGSRAAFDIVGALASDDQQGADGK